MALRIEVAEVNGEGGFQLPIGTRDVRLSFALAVPGANNLTSHDVSRFWKRLGDETFLFFQNPREADNTNGTFVVFPLIANYAFLLIKHKTPMLQESLSVKRGDTETAVNVLKNSSTLSPNTPLRLHNLDIIKKIKEHAGDSFGMFSEEDLIRIVCRPIPKYGLLANVLYPPSRFSVTM